MKARATVFLLAFLGAFLLLAPRIALAQNKDGAAKALAKKAMEEDYLGTDFTAAQAKLEKAINGCGTEKCSAPVRALIRVDLGVVLIGGLNDVAKGTAAFVEALKIDGSIQLDADLKTKEIEAAWANAKKQVGAAGNSGTPVAIGGPPPAGDFTHNAVAVQQYRTPVPIYAEYSGEEKLVRVIAKYKGLGMNEFKALELKKIGETGWGALVPCADVQTGVFQYYLQGFNEQNDPVAVAGNPKNTYKVSIQREPLTGDAPHLPNEPPPTACADTGDCPPDFPGCKKPTTEEGPTGKDKGETCEEDNECKSKVCEKKKNESEGVCAESSAGKAPRFFVGLDISFDFGFVSGADDVCKLHPKDSSDPDQTSATPINTAGYYCVRSDGTDFPARTGSATTGENSTILLNSPNRTTDHINGGSAPGNLRLLASFDYAATQNVLIGARAGVALLGYPGSAAQQDGKRFSLAPLHLEARGTYVIGKDGIAKVGVQPYVMAAFGVAPFETQVPVTVLETQTGGTVTPVKATAWEITGPFFLALGGGIRYAVTPKAAIVGGIRVDFALGNAFVPSIAPELGAQLGF